MLCMLCHTHAGIFHLPNNSEMQRLPHTPHENQGLPAVEYKTLLQTPTSLDLLRRRTNFPSSSTSSTATRPLVRACCEKLLLLSVDSSLRFLVVLPPPCVWDE